MVRMRGLTLVEMLTAFVLLGLVSTLLFQGTGIFAKRYETVQRFHREGTVTGLQQHWFITTVQSLVPYGREARRFRGDASSFQGITLQPLASEPGMPTGVRWFIDDRDGLRALVYSEERGPSTQGVEWTVLAAPEPELQFRYADTQGRWHVRWPVEGVSTDWLPGAIGLFSSSDSTLWLARIEASANPVVTEEDFR